MLGLTLRGIAERLSEEFASGDRCHGWGAAGKTVNWPVCRSLTVTLLLGFWLFMKVAAPIAVSIEFRQYWVLSSSKISNSSAETVRFDHLLQSSSASRFTASHAGFFILSQSFERPERYSRSPSLFDTMPSSPTI